MTSGQPSANASTADWLVFADQLQANGDARGELIALNHALTSGGSTETRDAYVKAHAEQLFGPLGKFVDALKLDWRWSLIDRAEITVRKDADAAAVAALIASPLAVEMTALSVVGQVESEKEKIDLTPALAAISEVGLPASCRSLSLIDGRAAQSTSVIATFYDPPPNLVDFHELAPLWPKLAGLEKLHLSVSDAEQLQFGEIALPALKSFQLDCLTIGGADRIPDAFDDAAWPQLESFAVRLTEHWTSSRPDSDRGYIRPYEFNEDDEYDDDDDAHHENFLWTRLRPLLESFKKTKLKRLALTSFQTATNVLAAIDDIGLPETVTELDLSDSAIDSAAVELLLADRSLMRQLKRLVLERTPASADDVKKLERPGLEVVHSEGGGATYRFLVGME